MIGSIRCAAPIGGKSDRIDPMCSASGGTENGIDPMHGAFGGRTRGVAAGGITGARCDRNRRLRWYGWQRQRFAFE
jgi:hypothetical protein